MQIPMTVPPESAAFLQAVGIAATMYSPPELAQWLQSGQPLIGGKTPLQLLAECNTMPLFNVMRALDERAYI